MVSTHPMHQQSNTARRNRPTTANENPMILHIFKANSPALAIFFFDPPVPMMQMRPGVMRARSIGGEVARGSRDLKGGENLGREVTQESPHTHVVHTHICGSLACARTIMQWHTTRDIACQSGSGGTTIDKREAKRKQV